jgi:hypothetical protein
MPTRASDRVSHAVRVPQQQSVVSDELAHGYLMLRAKRHPPCSTLVGFDSMNQLSLIDSERAKEMGLGDLIKASSMSVQISTVHGPSPSAQTHPVIRVLLSTARADGRDHQLDKFPPLEVEVEVAVVPQSMMTKIGSRGRNIGLLLSNRDIRLLEIDMNAIIDATDDEQIPYAVRRQGGRRAGDSDSGVNKHVHAGATFMCGSNDPVCKSAGMHRFSTHTDTNNVEGVVGVQQRPGGCCKGGERDVVDITEGLGYFPNRGHCLMMTADGASEHTGFVEAVRRSQGTRVWGSLALTKTGDDAHGGAQPPFKKCLKTVKCFASESRCKAVLKQRDERERLKPSSGEVSVEQWLESVVCQELEPEQKDLATAMLRRLRDKGVFSSKPGLIKEPPLKAKWKKDSNGKPLHESLRPVGQQAFGEAQARILNEYTDEQVRNGTARLVGASSVRHVNRAHIVLDNAKDPPKVRVTHDLTEVNKLEEDTAQAMPNAADIHDKMVGFKYQSWMDLTAFYTQHPLHEDDQEMYSIRVPRGVLVPNRLVFGAKRYTTYMNGLLHKYLGDVKGFWTAFWSFVDDLFFAGNDFAEHVRLIEEVAMILHAHGLTIHPNKIRVGFPKAKVLGKVVSAAGLEPSEEHVEAIRRAKLPETKEDAASILNLCQYYIKHGGPDYAPLAAKVRRIDEHSREERQEAFDELKRILTSAPVLVPFDRDTPIVLDSDASKEGCGCTLAHMVNRRKVEGRYVCDEERPIAYYSHAFDATQRSWSPYCREFYGCVFGIDKARHYIDMSNHKVLLRTDHRPILWWSKSRSIMASRWYEEYVHGMEIEVEYRKGIQHINADEMSRFFVSCLSPGVPDMDGVTKCIEWLSREGALPMLKGTNKKMFVYAPDFEQRVDDTVRALELADYVPHRGCARRKHVDDGVIGGRILAPQASKAAAIATEQLDLSGGPLYVLMPTDLLPEVRPVTKEGRERLENASFWVMAAAGLSWLIAGTDEVVQPVDHKVVMATKARRHERVDKSLREATAEMADEPPEELKLELKDGLYVDEKGRVFVPESERAAVIAHVHGLRGHAGRDTLASWISKRFVWPGCAKDAMKVNKECVQCALEKANRSRKAVDEHFLSSDRPWEILGLDIYGPLTRDTYGKKYVLTMVDLFSGLTQFVALKEVSALIVVKEVLKWADRKSMPARLFTDCAKYFGSEAMDKACKELGIEHLFTAPYSPQQLGRVEVKHRTLGAYLRALSVSDRDVWSETLDQVASIINDTPSVRHKVSPHQIEYCGRKKVTALEMSLLRGERQLEEGRRQLLEEWEEDEVDALVAAMARVRQAWEKAMAAVNAAKAAALPNSGKGMQHEVGDRVVVYRAVARPSVSKKFLLQYHGPLEVMEKTATNIYALEDEATGKTVHASAWNMSPFTPSVEAAAAFWEAKGLEKSELKDWVAGEMHEVTDQIVVGETIMIRDREHSDAKKHRYYVGTVVSFDPEEGEQSLRVHLFNCLRGENPLFTPTWIHQRTSAPSYSHTKPDQSEPWIWTGSHLDAVLADCAHRPNGKGSYRLDDDSLRAVKKWKWAATTQSVRNKKAGVRHEKPKARHKA